MANGRIKRAWLWTIKHSFNHLTLAMARSGVGPFMLVRHVGRKSGRTFETPILHARVVDGFVAVLVYGPAVSWYRNLRAAGHGVVVRGRREYVIDRIEPFPTDAGLRAFALPLRVYLKAVNRTEFRLLHIGGIRRRGASGETAGSSGSGG